MSNYFAGNDHERRRYQEPKLDSYRTIATLMDCVIVSHRERRITVHSRGSDGNWTATVAIAGGE